jgi:hypothetical protein
MKKRFYMALLLTTVMVTACSKNYYSNFGSKSSKGCGCPGSKGI